MFSFVPSAITHKSFLTGLSWHIMVVLFRNEAGELQITAMAYLMGNIKQDYFSVLSNAEDYLGFLKRNILPGLKVSFFPVIALGYLSKTLNFE